MTSDLTDQDRADLARILHELIEADRYPFSPKVRRWKELLAKLDPAPASSVTPYPAPKRAGVPSLSLSRKKQRRR